MTKALGIVLAVMVSSILQPRAAEEKAILKIIPSIAELGEHWSTNIIAYLIDPRSDPPEIDSRGDPKMSPALAVQREEMKGNGRTGCALVLYGWVNFENGLHRVFVQRWENRRALHNQWVRWKMDPNRVVRDANVGEDYFWTEEWWRQTLVRQNFIFRRGLFHIVIEASAETDPAHMVRLAAAFDVKIRARNASSVK